MNRSGSREVTLSVSTWGPRPPVSGETRCSLCGDPVEPDENRVDVDSVEHRVFHEACFDFHLDGLLAFREQRGEAVGRLLVN